MAKCLTGKERGKVLLIMSFRRFQCNTICELMERESAKSIFSIRVDANKTGILGIEFFKS